jgi:hypothetical protein
MLGRMTPNLGVPTSERPLNPAGDSQPRFVSLQRRLTAVAASVQVQVDKMICAALERDVDWDLPAD